MSEATCGNDCDPGIAALTRLLICLKPLRDGTVIIQPLQAGARKMPKFGMKAVLTAFTLRRSRQKRPDWDRVIIIFSTAVTIGLVAAYLYGKATSRW